MLQNHELFFKLIEVLEIRTRRLLREYTFLDAFQLGLERIKNRKITIDHLLTSVAHVGESALRSAAHGQEIVFTDEDRHLTDVEIPIGGVNHLQHHEYAFAVLFDLGPLMPVAGIFNSKLVQSELFLHGFKLRRLRIRQTDPNKAVGLVNIEMNLANRDIGEFATILISDTVDEHVAILP